MPSSSTSRRRRRSEIEDDEDVDIVRSSERSTPSSSDSSKRARTNRRELDTPSESPEPEDSRAKKNQPRRRTVNGLGQANNAEGSEDEEAAGISGFQPGAIVRVKLIDFVTYSNAEFFPGPNLNMIIGPNGTGKSSFVCAICLGLGWGPQHLGRAGQYGEFVKHGCEFSIVEIELQKRRNETSNHVVRVKIIKDGNGREWWLGGKRTSLKAVQSLCRSLSIQIDNLCQFLPQDKVSEFAALSPVELLLQTQRAAAPEQMLEWHDELKKNRADQKKLEEQLARDKEHLSNLENRQESLQAEVQRLQERNEIQEKVALLKKTIPFVEYNNSVDEYKAFKKRKEDAQLRLGVLEAQVEPTLRSVKHKEEYGQQIQKVVAERRKALTETEAAADRLLAEIDRLEENMREIELKLDTERKTEGERRKKCSQIEKRIADLEAQLQDAPVEFNAGEWNEKIVS